MKQLLPIVLFVFTKLCVGQSQLKFDKDTIDLGTVTIELDSLGHEKPKFITLDFPFANTGNEPLILFAGIADGNGTADVPKSPILPKHKGILKVSFTRYRYTGYLKTNEGLRPFCTPINIKGNFPEAQKVVCIKGFVKVLK